MVELETHDLTDADVLLMSVQMRPIDGLECDVMSGGEARSTALKRLKERSFYAKAAYLDGRLALTWGIQRQTLLSDATHPWALATPVIEEPEARRLFIRHSRAELRRMAQGRMWNMVHEKNKASIRYLRWLGFDFPEGGRRVIQDEPFVMFAMEA